MISDVFLAAVNEPFPRGISHSPQSRAIYAVDLMLEWQVLDFKANSASSCLHRMKPQICEVNFCPDFQRACQYYPNFLNQAFDSLFFETEESLSWSTRIV
ncbi:unnamed protein product [Protopolystoma xenopodis]|uniref:Uncharacterized protein n=1 Tax=Protopolystoma xenopodis TaxID=117903 RepID=A0A448WVZ8_9PLAT|nr:unnamed protein product [Protopolystoma xenopodis]